jgi:putative hemolysin
VNGGETQQTSRVVTLPAGASVYVRLWTKVGGLWRYSDSTFTAANVDSPLVSTITSPAHGSTVTQATTTIQWRAIANVQAYYLYLGSSPGGRNYVDTGEIQATSRVVSLPAGQTIYARLWTKVGGLWRYSDSSFSVAAGATSLFSIITSPASGAIDVPATVTVQWTTVANVQAYYLYIGTTVGAKDLVDTQEIQTTSRLVTLPAGKSVYARMWAKTGGIWRYTDSSFTTAATPSVFVPTLTFPANNATNVATAVTALWTSVANAEAYYLYVGSSPGAKDYVNSGEIQATSRLISVPAGQLVYARIWAKVGGVWRYSDSSFATAGTQSSLVSTVTSPPNGATNVATRFPVQWSAVDNVQAYYLYMGSSPGAKDLVDSGETLQTSRLVTLPAGRTIYVRLWTKVGDTWRFSDSSFTTQ